MVLQEKLLGFLVSVLQAILYAASISMTTVLILLFWMMLSLMRMQQALSKERRSPIWFWVPSLTLSRQNPKRLMLRLPSSRRLYTMTMFQPEQLEAPTGIQPPSAAGLGQQRISPTILHNQSGKSDIQRAS